MIYLFGAASVAEITQLQQYLLISQKLAPKSRTDPAAEISGVGVHINILTELRQLLLLLLMVLLLLFCEEFTQQHQLAIMILPVVIVRR
jgi:hypothetical protein